MKQYYQTGTLVLLLSLCLASCQDNKKDYPTKYVGFERSSDNYYYDKNNTEETIELKIIAADKEKSNRVVKITATSITIPGEGAFYQLIESQVTIQAGHKSATARIKIFPNRVIKRSLLRVVCTPQWKDEEAKESQISLRMLPK